MPFGLPSPDSGSLLLPRWTDKSFPMGRDRQGVFDKPDFDFTELGLLFPQNDPSEKAYVIDQELHEKKLGTALKLHVHYIQSGILTPVFKADYRYYNNNETPPGWTTIQTVASPVFPVVDGKLQIITFPEIPAPADENVSANIDLIFYRDDNVVSGDILVKYLDYHYQKDSDGSRQEFIK